MFSCIFLPSLVLHLRSDAVLQTRGKGSVCVICEVCALGSEAVKEARTGQLQAPSKDVVSEVACSLNNPGAWKNTTVLGPHVLGSLWPGSTGGGGTFRSRAIFQGLLWWLSGKEPACRCRRHGFSLRSGKIPHATGQLRPCATTVEPALQSPGAADTEPTFGSY